LNPVTDRKEENKMTSTPNKSSAASIALAWLVVLIPAAWGVYLTAMRAASLFK
jgi:hypothetical protein